MGMTKDFELPRDLTPFRDILQQTVVPTSHITLSNRATTIYNSKFGGEPYLPKNRQLPKDSHGHDMRLLAQINFSEVLLPQFPKQGILQFFIPQKVNFQDEESYEDIWQHHFKIRYYNDLLAQDQLALSPHAVHKNAYFPLQQEKRLHFEQTDEIVSIMDYRFQTIFDTPLSLLFNDDGINLYDIYMKHFLGQGHKMGGYPYFTKQDPRERYPFLRKYDVLLLQIESDDENGIMWGDCGVANFFINSTNLANADFSDILYHWDHY